MKGEGKSVQKKGIAKMYELHSNDRNEWFKKKKKQEYHYNL